MAANEASYEDAAELAKQWSAAVLQCRTLGHAWRQSNATLITSLNYWRVNYTCIRGCNVTKVEEWNSRGVVIGKGMHYPKDPETGEALYLTEHIGRINSDAKGALRLENATRGPNDRKTGRLKPEDEPSRLSTRRGLGLD